MAMISATEFDECAAAVGGMKKLADAMNVSLQTITNWRSRGVPSSECRAFESVTGIGVHEPDFKKRKRRKIFQPRKRVFPLRIIGGSECVTKRTNSGRSGATPKSST